MRLTRFSKGLAILALLVVAAGALAPGLNAQY
jgi:hypothetical protein